MQRYEPDELVHKAKGEYRTKTHGSLTISNGLWNWFKGGVGGKNALDYLVKIKNMKFIDAVIYLSKLEHINDLKNNFHENKSNQIDNQDCIKLQLPKKNQNNYRVVSYLKSRGICEDIITKCIEQDLIYEDANHNVIFVGYDEQVVLETETGKLPIQDNEEILMLYTCYNPEKVEHTPYRFVIYAKKI